MNQHDYFCKLFFKKLKQKPKSAKQTNTNI